MGLDSVAQEGRISPKEAEATNGTIGFYAKVLGPEAVERCKKEAEEMSSEEAAFSNCMTIEDYLTDNWIRLLRGEYQEKTRQDLRL